MSNDEGRPKAIDFGSAKIGTANIKDVTAVNADAVDMGESEIDSLDMEGIRQFNTGAEEQADPSSRYWVLIKVVIPILAIVAMVVGYVLFKT
jgi:hypothetical protein